MPETELPAAGWGRRILALVVDWTVCTLVVIAFVGLESYSEPGSVASAYTLVVYVAESTVLGWAVGGSFGKLVTGLRIVPTDGRIRPMNPLKVFLRQVMVALVIPPLVFRPNGRGLHDMVADTVTVTNDTFRSLVAAG